MLDDAAALLDGDGLASGNTGGRGPPMLARCRALTSARERRELRNLAQLTAAKCRATERQLSADVARWRMQPQCGGQRTRWELAERAHGRSSRPAGRGGGRRRAQPEEGNQAQLKGDLEWAVWNIP